MQLFVKAIMFLGMPSAIVIGGDIGGLWSAPPSLLAIAYTTIALILAAGILVGIFSKAD